MPLKSNVCPGDYLTFVLEGFNRRRRADGLHDLKLSDKLSQLALDNMYYSDYTWTRSKFAQAGQYYKLFDEDKFSSTYDGDEFIELENDANPFGHWDKYPHHGRPVYTYVEGENNRLYTNTEWARTVEIGIACKALGPNENDEYFFNSNKLFWMNVYFDPPKDNAGHIEKEHVCLPGWRWVMNTDEDDKSEKSVDF